MHDGLVQKSSPSFQTLTKDISSPGSSEYPSVFSDKSNYHDCSDGRFIGNSVLSLTDTEKFSSTNSISLVSRQFPVANDVSQSYLTNSSNFPSSCLSNQYALNCNPHITISTPNSFPSVCTIYSPSFFHTSYTKSGYLLNTKSICSVSVNERCNMYHDPQYKSASYFPQWEDSYVYRQPQCVNNSVRYNIPNSASFHSPNISTVNSSYLFNRLTTNYIPGKNESIGNNRWQEYMVYSLSKNRHDETVPRRFGHEPGVYSSFNYGQPNPIHSAFSNRSFGLSHSQQQVNYKSDECSVSVHCQTNNQLYPINANRIVELPVDTHNCCVPSAFNLYNNIRQPHINVMDHSHTVTSDSSLSPNTIPRTTSNLYLPMSFNEKPSIAMTNQSDKRNSTGFTFSVQNPSEECSKLKQKRKLSKITNRGGKYRRSSATDTPSLSSSISIRAPFELMVHSILLQNVKKYIQNPTINPLYCIYPPFPYSSSSKHCAIFSDFGQVVESYALKYLCFPFTPLKPQLKPINEQYILQFISQPIEMDQFAKLIDTNFLIKSYKSAINRSSNSTYFSPPTPEAPTSPLIEFEANVSTSDKRFNCVTPPLTFKIVDYLKSDKLDKYHNTNFKYREEVISLEHLMIESNNIVTICANCAMQIFPPNIPFVLNFSSKNVTNTFCSHCCLMDYKKQLNNGQNNITQLAHLSDDDNNYHSTITTTTLSDIYQLPVIVILRHNITKQIKRSTSHEESKIRKRQLNGYPHIRNYFNNCVRNKWRNIRWQKWTNRPCSNKTLKPKPLSFNLICKKLYRISPNPAMVMDKRICYLCHEKGDGLNDVTNRLINLDVGKWLHLNCILWCYETYETISGSLVDVDRSLNKATKTICAHCNKFGAGLPCFDSDCQFIYHLPCANKIGCSFHSDRSMYCPLHKPNANGPQLNNLNVDRRVYITRDEDAQVASIISNEDLQTKSHLSKLRIGTLILHRLGQLLPDQLASNIFHTANFIYPVGFWSTRIYWSYRHIGLRCRYDCRIEDQMICADSENHSLPQSSIRFVVEVIEENEDNYLFQDVTCNGVWQQILTKINALRQTSSFLQIFHDHLHGETLFGLTEPHIIRAVESLPAVDQLSNYVFKFGKLQLIKEMPLALNPTGCARSEPKSRSYIRRKFAGEAHNSSHSLLNLKIFDTCAFNLSEMGSPTYLSPQSPTLTNKYQQYRRLRYEWRTNVTLARSRIQGLGLYASRDISKHIFIIEYLGEVIRNELGNTRERLYESQNRGIYMFSVDNDWIVDATMCGCLARYINHSCDPNCTAEILNCDNGSHIVIIASKNIEKGDELTYDYKFDLAEDRWDRIPCLCGSTNCRKWMN